MGWFVLYTKAKAERKVAHNLSEANIEVFCPTVKEVRQWSDRKKKIEVPLFKSYVFVRLKNNERTKVFDFPGVVRYLFWLGKPAIARDEEIETIKNWLEEDVYDEFYVAGISPGDRVEIKTGPFKNKKGIVRNIGSKRMRLTLQEMGITVNVKLKEIA